MGIAKDVGTAFYKASLAAGIRLPQSGTAFITVNRRDKEAVVDTARKLVALGFDLLATRGTASVLRSAGLPVSETLKRSEGRPNCVDAIRSGQINLIVNTPLGGSAYKDGWEIRTAALQHQVPCITTLSGAIAAVEAIASQKGQALTVVSLQELEHLSL